MMKTGDRIGGYELLDKLGEGGMAEVWKACSIALERVVAIKFLLERFTNDPDLQQRFLQEGRLQARLQHPQIVGILHAGAENGRAFLVTDFVEGQSLEELLHANGGKPLPVEEVLSISYDVLAALEYAHNLPQGAIVHRDVKPSNILLDGKGRARLADFGIAVALNEDRKTKTGFALGSVFYMSPEQIQTPRAIDWRSDIYSFGCVLYEMLTGRPPFGGETDSDFTIKQAHVQTPPEPMRKWNPQVPFEFEWIVFRALSKDRERRFSSAAEMADALRPIVPGTRREKPQRTSTLIESRLQQKLPGPVPAPAPPQLSQTREEVEPPAKKPGEPVQQAPPTYQKGTARPFWKRILSPDFSNQESADQAIKTAAFMCFLAGLAILGNELGNYDRMEIDFNLAALLAGILAVGVWKRRRIAVAGALTAAVLGVLVPAGDAIDYMNNYMGRSQVLRVLLWLLFGSLPLALIPIYVRALRDLQPSRPKASDGKSRIASRLILLVLGGLLAALLVLAFRTREIAMPILMILGSVIALGPWRRWKIAMLAALILSPVAAFYFGWYVHEGRWYQGSWMAVFFLVVSFTLLRALSAAKVYPKLSQGASV